MKANEFTALTKDNIKYDIVEDIYTFMLNDSAFYRQHFFPTAQKYGSNEGVQAGQMTEVWRPVIDAAVSQYFEKFKINAKPAKLITDEDRNRLVGLIQQGLQKFPIKNDR